jgi:CRISPR-associated protein Cmr2
MNESRDFAPAIAACFDYDNTLHRDELSNKIRDLFDEKKPIPQSKEELHQRNDELNALTGGRKIALVYGGATKIKDYVFEAPKLPEIRGASALLDWVNEVELPKLWGADTPEQFVEKGIIYASGGGFLAFAPADKGQALATSIERCYTEHTLTANSVAVCETFNLLELRYGRNPLTYWLKEFEEQWNDPKLQPTLQEYYYGNDEDMLADRFYRRKTFGELVTLLTIMVYQRREERASHGEPRSVLFYPMMPWAEKCDSSDIRPAVWSGTVADEQREMSKASARKRYVGQVVKKEEDKETVWYRTTFTDWSAPPGLEARCWERQWEEFLEDPSNQTKHYVITSNSLPVQTSEIQPPQDVGQIGQTSSPDRYIGIIYADGNNVGRLIATLQTPQAYSRTSAILRRAATDAVFHALSQHLEPQQVRSDKGEMRWVHPFEILAIGGDDLFLIVPADKTFDIALTIGLTFEQMLAKELQHYVPNAAFSSAAFKGRYNADSKVITDDYKPPIGLSAGVIIAQENAPIFFLRDQVEELLKSAKKLARHNVRQGYYGGAVDFMVMKSITMVIDNIKAFRKAALGDGDVSKQESLRRLTARPYTWHEFAGLLETVRALKRAHVPRSQLYRIRRVMSEETASCTIASTMGYLYTRTRLRNEVSNVLVQHIECNWRGASHPKEKSRQPIPPWLPMGRRSWETIWPDLIEVYEMITLPEQEET